MKNLNPLHFILGGAGLVVIANTLPWVSVDADKDSLMAAAAGSYNGWSRDGIIIFILAGAAVALTMIKNRGKEKVMSLIAMICAGLALLIGLYDLSTAFSAVSNANEVMVAYGGKAGASVGIGLWLVTLASAVLGFGCFLRWQSLPNPPAGSFPPPGSPPPPPSAPPPMPPQG